MRLITLKQYRNLRFSPESAPSMHTLRERFEDIPGHKRVLGRLYVDIDEHDEVVKIGRQLDSKRSALANDPALQGLV